MLEKTETGINSKIISAIEIAECEKSTKLQFIGSLDHSQKISFEKDSGFANGYYKTLERWMKNPQDLKEGRAGYPLEIFYKELLIKMFPEQSVYLAPSSLDRKPVDSIPTADIVIGEEINKNLFYPLLLVSSKLTSGSKSLINPLLNTPEVTLNARKIWGRRKTLELLPYFAKTENIDNFLSDVLHSDGVKIKERILEGFLEIDKDNIVIKEDGKRKIKNIIVYKKMLSVKHILSES